MTKSAPRAARIIRFEDLPHWLFALLTVGGFNAIAFGGLVCTRRFGQWLGLYTVIDNDTVSAIFSAVLVMYAISLGLIAVASWGNSSAAAAAASEEASHIATVYRTLGGFPQPLQDDLKDSVVRYTQSIIEKAWPAQQRRGVTEEGIEIILHLWRQITQFEQRLPAKSWFMGRCWTISISLWNFVGGASKRRVMPYRELCGPSSSSEPQFRSSGRTYSRLRVCGYTGF